MGRIIAGKNEKSFVRIYGMHMIISETRSIRIIRLHRLLNPSHYQHPCTIAEYITESTSTPLHKSYGVQASVATEADKRYTAGYIIIFLFFHQSQYYYS